jgi:hypothetical protein
MSFDNSLDAEFPKAVKTRIAILQPFLAEDA